MTVVHESPCPAAPRLRAAAFNAPQRTRKHRLCVLGTNLVPGREQGPAGGKRELGGARKLLPASPLCPAFLPALHSCHSSEIAVSSASCFAVQLLGNGGVSPRHGVRVSRCCHCRHHALLGVVAVRCMLDRLTLCIEVLPLSCEICRSNDLRHHLCVGVAWECLAGRLSPVTQVISRTCRSG